MKTLNAADEIIRFSGFKPWIKDSQPDATVSAYIAGIIEKHTAHAELVAALQALPDADTFETPDAADFVDHSRQFMNAMRLAKDVLAKLEARP
jgi:hypothetical protein